MPATLFPTALTARLAELCDYPAQRRVLQHLRTHAHSRYLLIGHGSGQFILKLLKIAAPLYIAGTESDPELFRIAGRRISATDRGRADLKNIADFPLPWPQNSFDAVIAIHSFHHWLNPRDTLQDIHRVLKPGGQLLIAFRQISQPRRGALPNPLSRDENEAQSTIQLLHDLNLQIVNNNNSVQRLLLSAVKLKP